MFLKKMKGDAISKSQTKKQRQSKTGQSVRLVHPDHSSKLPQLADVPTTSKEELFVRKLKLCSMIYNFLEGTNMKEKQIKFNTLKELILFTTEEGNVSLFTEPTYKQIIEMISDNIFRNFPPAEYADFDPEYDEQQQEAAWPHLKLVYDFLLHVLNSPEADLKILKRVIDQPFITKLLDIFDSEDARERKCLKSVLLTIYLKFFEQRSFIRRQIRNVFLNYIYEVEQFNGIAELLEILSMAVNGYNVPLKQEHKDFLIKVLVPLHKPRYLAFYQRCLIECFKGFLKKDENLFEDIIMGILKFWPRTCSEKEVLFLQELTELLERVSSQQFVKIQEPLMKQISISISSLHFQVAETALNLWDNPEFLRHFNDNLKVLMPIVFPDLYRISKNHWNSEISDLASNLLQTFNEADSTLYGNLVATSKFKAKKGKKAKKV